MKGYLIGSAIGLVLTVPLGILILEAPAPEPVAIYFTTDALTGLELYIDGQKIENVPRDVVLSTGRTYTIEAHRDGRVFHHREKYRPKHTCVYYLPNIIQE